MGKRSKVSIRLDTNIDNWLLSFYLSAGKPVIKARHLLDNTFLQAPDDSLQIAQIIPVEEWPAFALPLYRRPDHNPSQERLFS